ncbi:hypothetical protein HDV00_009064 [Rhizophlyctis rosea]|nr:hypothetical protein HDV00_009064 [Rhizophlyctis rosea]
MPPLLPKSLPIRTLLTPLRPTHLQTRCRSDSPLPAFTRPGGIRKPAQRYTEENRKRDRRMGPGPQLYFKPGETYDPQDLNNENIDTWIKRHEKKEREDVVTREGLNPIMLPKTKFKDPQWLAQFVTEMGMILPRWKTGLNGLHQRKVTKTIKRAQQFGFMPVTYKP